MIFTKSFHTFHTILTIPGYDERNRKEKSKMKNFWKWILGIAIVLVVFFGLGLLTRYLGMQFGGYSGRGWHMPMMGFGFMPFGMAFMWLFPLAFLALPTLGIVWAIKALRGTHPAAPGKACAQCGKPVQADWKNCPHCGSTL
jgi:hypothetical protein